ncbi:hypothetical protein JL721_5183 [Aureococcus anophagefferens]|nr:hypothetical protein JL721_5183 [Aureococcus anophagefferens]
MALSSSVPADMKACKSFLQRAEELDRASDPNAKVVAYHCRQYAMELGIALRDRAADAEAATAFLLGLMDALEHEKKALGDVSREDGEQIVFQFASDVFARADAEDRARAATKNTARTFYAASVFFDALKQFGERGEEVEEKTRYAKWKATEILKAIKEGREVAPGGPGDEPELPDIPAAHDAIPAGAAAPPRRRRQPPGQGAHEAQFDDAIEYCKFAIAACEVKDTALALDRLRGAFTSLS